MVKQGSSASGGDENKYPMMDEKKRKRMISNRESARRSRFRREQHIMDLNSEIASLGIKNGKVSRKIDSIGQQFSVLSCENQRLARERGDLMKRLESIEIVSSYVCGYERDKSLACNSQPWELPPPHQSVSASNAMFLV